jgi:hypothetical protein
MRRRVPVVFWSATLVAVILLGVTWTQLSGVKG